MKKTSWIFAFALLNISFLTGCASILGSGKTVQLNKNPVDAAVIAYDSKGNKTEIVTTAEKISFKKAGNYTLEFSQKDYMPDIRYVNKKFNHSFWLNFLISGLGASGIMLNRQNVPFPLYPYSSNIYAYAGYGLGEIGIIGVLIDLFSG